MGMNAMEIDTAVRHKIPILIVISLNGGWTGDPKREKPGRDLGYVRFDKMCEALGGYGEYITQAGGYPSGAGTCARPRWMRAWSRWSTCAPTIGRGSPGRRSPTIRPEQRPRAVPSGPHAIAFVERLNALRFSALRCCSDTVGRKSDAHSAYPQSCGHRYGLAVRLSRGATRARASPPRSAGDCSPMSARMSRASIPDNATPLAAYLNHGKPIVAATRRRTRGRGPDHRRRRAR